MGEAKKLYCPEDINWKARAYVESQTNFDSSRKSDTRDVDRYITIRPSTATAIIFSAMAIALFLATVIII